MGGDEDEARESHGDLLSSLGPVHTERSEDHWLSFPDKLEATESDEMNEEACL